LRGKYQPKIVVLLVGTNDSWNLQNSQYYLFQNNASPRWHRFRNLLWNCKTYKLLKIALSGMRLPSRPQQAAADSGTTSERRAARRPSPQAAARLKAAWECFGQKRDFPAARALLEPVLRQNPEDDDAYFLLGRIEFDSGDLGKAEQSFRHAVILNPYHFEARAELLRLYRRTGQASLAGKELDALARLQPGNETWQRFQKYGMPSDDDHRWLYAQLISNLSGIAEDTKSRGMILILQTYPNQQAFPAIQEAIKCVGKKYRLPLVDNEDSFALSKSLGAEFFRPDGHPNEKGYAIMARDVLKQLRPLVGSQTGRF
jgi:tetratricopeptide (TPR) repeat protein